MPHIADVYPTLAQAPANASMHVVDPLRGVVEAFPRRRGVIIRGAGGGREEAPTEDTQWEIWALNATISVDRHRAFRADRWFDLHEMHAQSETDLRWLRACPVPLYLVPQAFRGNLGPHQFYGNGRIEDGRFPVRYPIERIEGRYGSYFACSFAYMLALAIDEGFTDIGLFGCELAFGTERERSMEWANVSWWVGYAEAKGLNIHVPSKGSLLGQHRYRYGLEYDEEKHDVEQYINLMRQADIVRKIDKTQPYDSAKEDWLHKPERAQA
jgi:hypothetical protein